MNQKASYPGGAALVLGGSGGLGAACAKQIIRDGNNVAITYHANREAAQAVQISVDERLSAEGLGLSIHHLDISDKSLCSNVIDDVVAEHGRINSLVYAIGSSIGQPLVGEISEQQWSEVVKNDLNGFINIVQPVIRHMRENGGGSLVHLSSAGLGKTPPRDALSIAPKAAIDALMSTIAVEEGVNGIRANMVGVGVIEAGIFKRLEAQGVFDDNWKAAVKAALPMASFGEAEDIAEAVTFFVSSRSKYITGQRLFVDGGYSA